MKVSALATLILGAGIVQVAAVPIRVILVSTSIQEGAAPLDHARFGHSMPYLKPEVARMMAPTAQPKVGGRHHRPCRGGRMAAMRQKSIEISNSFRKALGWPLIEPHHIVHHHHPHHDHPMHAMSGGASAAMVMEETGAHHHNPYGQPLHIIAHHPPPPPPRFQRISGQSNFRGDDFMSRLMYSLANLGRWEGRAVAFVLGCGIGVLLRMLYVLFVVAYRAVRGPREDEQEYSHVIMFETTDAVDAPPSYSAPAPTADEKAALESRDKVADSVKPCHR